MHGKHDRAYKVIKDLNKSEKDTVLINPIHIKKWEEFYKNYGQIKTRLNVGWLEMMRMLTLSHKKSIWKY